MSARPNRLMDPRDPAELRAEFDRLAADWKRASAYLSNTLQMALLKPYQRIIGLGPAVVPLILAELEAEPNHWFWALESITGEDPVPAAVRGQVRAMADAWLAWGRENGLVG